MVASGFPALADQSVTLAWDPNTEPDLAGYKMYYGIASGSYSYIIDVGNVTTNTVSGLAEGVTYFFAVTAYNTSDLESDFSNEVNYTPAPSTPTNQPPTLDLIADLVINEDAGVQIVLLTGISSGASNEFQTLALSASSSNPALIPNPGVSYISPNSVGSLSFASSANANGTAVILVTVDDGQTQNNLTSRSFTVTVTPVNDPPTLDLISDLIINEDAGLQTVPLTGISSGAPNEFQTLTVSATSSNPALIPNPAISYTSPNATGTLSFAPLANGNGTAVITVTVDDGQSQNNLTSRSFTLTVKPVNDPPTLSGIANQTISKNQSTSAIPFQIADIETAASSLTLSATSANTTLVPSANIVFGGSGSSRTVTVTPARGKTGTALITIKVSDGQATASTSFSLTVLF